MACCWRRWLVVLAGVWLLAGAFANPVRRSAGDPEARRRSAVDRHMIRLGRSYPAEPSAADLREALQRTLRRGDSFVRLGRSQAYSAEDLISLLREYEDENGMDKRSPSNNFIRFGRDPSFIRFGRSPEENKTGYEKHSDLVVNGYPERSARAGDHFLRLGRDSEEFNDAGYDDEEDRNKRSAQ